MRLLISYFYKIRFFTPNMIPLSTAVWDPKWYHSGGDIFVDNNGVINGMRIEYFMPDKTCDHLCRGMQNCTQTPDSCAFLQAYSKQLDRLNFNNVMSTLQAVSDKLQISLNLEKEPTLVLMVYEPPYKPCSERVPIIAWFKKHGYDLCEFHE